MCDQLNASVLGLYGGPVRAPHLDELAREGVVFDRAYCQTPFCTPSRATILTGLYPHRHGLVHNVMRRDYPTTAHLTPPGEEGLDESDVTFETLLRARGYRTGHYGKWHLSGPDLSCHPDRYREHYEYPEEVRELFGRAERRDRRDWMNWYGWKLPVSVPQSVRDGFERLEPGLRDSGLADFYAKMGRLEMRLEDTFDWRVADRTIGAIRGSGRDPFVITCSFNWPHDPNVSPDPFYGMFDPAAISYDHEAPCEARFAGELSRALAVQGGEELVREFLRIYYANVTLVDGELGRVLGALRECGRWEDTIVVFTSDHGDMAGEHGMFWKSTSAFYDGVARVPLVIRAPGLHPGRKSFPVELADLCPTLLELAGAEPPQEVHGESLLPYCDGRADPSGRIAVSERIAPNRTHTRRIGPDQRGSFMLCDGRHKYVCYADGGEYLYDLEADPAESRNLAGDRATRGLRSELSRRLRSRLEATACPASSLW